MSALAEVLRTKLIPWSQRDAVERFIVARPKMLQARMPSGVRLRRHKLEPPRVVVKGRRCYSNVRNVIAEWPNAGLHELGKYALICTLDGYVDYPLGHYKLQCGPGYFFFIPPGLPRPDGSRTYVDLEKSTSCDIITFLQHPNALECWLSHGHAGGREQSDSCLILHDHAISLFQTLLAEVVENDERSLPIEEGLLSVFFHLMQREIGAGRAQYMRVKDPNYRNETATAASDFATRLEHYIQANLRQPLTLERAARAMYLSPAQFARNVRRETGDSFNRLLARHRLEEAKNLLRNSEWAIFSIAGLTGFRSVSYFCTFFKGCTGQTPSEFRARATENPKAPRKPSPPRKLSDSLNE